MTLRDKVAAVSGGSSGIGAPTVRMLAQERARVVVGYNKAEERARQLIQQLPGNGHCPLHMVLEESAIIRGAADTVRDA